MKITNELLLELEKVISFFVTIKTMDDLVSLCIERHSFYYEKIFKYLCIKKDLIRLDIFFQKFGEIFKDDERYLFFENRLNDILVANGIEKMKFRTKTTPNIRKLEAPTYPFLEDFLFEAIYIPEGSPPLDKSIIFQPELYNYVKDFGQENDLGFIIESDNKPVGAIWTRLFSDEQKGYGFVDNETPELSMAINANFRNQGFGRQLLEKMFLKLQESGYKKVSLSVDRRNFAYQLYQKVGFQEHQIEGNTVVMIKDL
jgi:ribosomal protein S18 acetylase RimI-like enzyme